MSDPDRDLLFGLTAWRGGEVGREALLSALEAWAAVPGRPLAEVLVERGALDAERRARIEATVAAEVEFAGSEDAGSPPTVAPAAAGAARDPFATRAEPATGSGSGPSWSGAPARGPAGGGGPGPEGMRFRIVRPHARGGLGEVFVARDEELGREVALKEIRDQHADDPSSRARFLLEAEITGGLEHPGVVPVYGLGRYPDGRPYYAMRFIRGDTLHEALARFHEADRPGRDPSERSMALRQLLGRFVAACDAVHYAHNRGVLHRDIKPANILLGPYGETLVVDWGLAKPMDRAEPDRPGGEGSAESGPRLRPGASGASTDTLPGSTLGTPHYMSPEQARGDLERLGPASDVYSLGVTLYHVLTGRTAFADAGDVAEVVRRSQAGEVPPPRRVNRRVPKALEAVCLKAMATDPSARYPSARALADEVERWLADEPVSARRDGPLTRLRRWGRRRPGAATLVAACLFADALALVLLFTTYVQTILHGRPNWALRFLVAALVGAPFAVQAAAAVGAALGGLVGATRRKAARGAASGARAAVPVGLVVLAIGAAAATRRESREAAPKAVEAGAVPWPSLPGAATEVPAWMAGKSDAPFDVAAWFVGPPEGRDAAPLYLDALMEFHPSMAACFAGDEARRRGAIAEDRDRRLARAVPATEADPSAGSSEEVDGLLSEFEAGFAKLAQAQRRPECVFRTGLGIEALLPHAEASRAVARAGRLRIRRALGRGEVDRAIDDVALLLRLARDLRRRGPLIAQLVSIAIDATALDPASLGAILAHPGLTADHCDRLTALLREHRAGLVDPFTEGYKHEYIGIGHTMHAWAARLAAEERFGGSRMRGAIGHLFASDAPIAMVNDAMARAYEETSRAIDARLARLGPERFVAEVQRTSDDLCRRLLALGDVPLRRRGAEADATIRRVTAEEPLLRFLTPDLPAVVAAAQRHEATLGAWQALVAVRRREIAGGRPLGRGAADRDLDAICREAGLPGAPSDPYREDGGPLRFGPAGLFGRVVQVEAAGGGGPAGRDVLAFRLPPRARTSPEAQPNP